MPNTEKTEACCLNYEAEYHRLMDEVSKMGLENDILRKELEKMEKSLLWYDGIKQALEVIFGREFYNG